MSYFSKQKGVVLKSENKFFLGRKEGDPKLLGEEVGWLFFGCTNILWWRKNKSWRFKQLFLREPTFASLLDST